MWTVALGTLGVGLAVLVVARTEVGAEALDDLAGRARLAPLVGASLFMSLAFFFMGLRWRALMPAGTHAPALGLWAILCSGLLLNFAVPGPFGELGAAWFASRRYRLDLSDALAAGIAARVIGLASAALMAALFGLTFDLAIPQGYERLVAAAAVVVGLGGGLLTALALRPRWWKAASARTLGRIGGASLVARAARRLDAMVAHFADALAQVVVRGRKAYLRATLWSVAGHACVIVGVFAAAWSLGARPSLGGVAFTYAASTAGTVALFALPGSQVGWDAMFFTLLVATAGLETAHALAIVGVVRLQQLGVMVFGALATGWLLRQVVGPAEDQDAGQVAPRRNPTAVGKSIYGRRG